MAKLRTRRHRHQLLPLPPVTVYGVEPCAAPGGPPRPCAGVAPGGAGARHPRPSRTPCADVPPARQPQPPAPAPVHDPPRSLCGLVFVPPDQVGFLGKNAQRRRFRPRVIVSPDLALQLAAGLIPRIVANVSLVSTCAMTSARQAVLWWEYTPSRLRERPHSSSANPAVSTMAFSLASAVHCL